MKQKKQLIVKAKEKNNYILLILAQIEIYTSI